jgi:hypothetical protein
VTNGTKTIDEELEAAVTRQRQVKGAAERYAAREAEASRADGELAELVRVHQEQRDTETVAAGEQRAQTAAQRRERCLGVLSHTVRRAFDRLARSVAKQGCGTAAVRDSTSGSGLHLYVEFLFTPRPDLASHPDWAPWASGADRRQVRPSWLRFACTPHQLIEISYQFAGTPPSVPELEGPGAITPDSVRAQVLQFISGALKYARPAVDESPAAARRRPARGGHLA